MLDLSKWLQCAELSWPNLEARNFFWVSLRGAEVSAAFPGNQQRAGSEMKQTGLEPAAVWDASVTNRGLVYYAHDAGQL